jgi:predicted ABC-type ATPase
MKSNGYRVVMIFLWLVEVETAIERVAVRVRQGGHFVADEEIRRRHAAGARNLFGLYRPLIDSLRIYDADLLPPTLIAIRRRNRVFLKQEETYRQLALFAEKQRERDQ